MQGRALELVGRSRFTSGDEEVSVSYFLVQYSGEPRGGEARARLEASIEEAIAALLHQDARDLLARARPSIECHARQG